MKTTTYPKARNLDHLFIMEVAVISTVHITKTDGQWLREAVDEIFARDRDEEWHMIRLGADWEDVFEAPIWSDAFRTVLYHFEKLGYGYVRFDGQCGEVLEDLPQFEW